MTTAGDDRLAKYVAGLPGRVQRGVAGAGPSPGRPAGDHPGGPLLCDNAFMEGGVADPEAQGGEILGMRQFNAVVADDRRDAAAVIPVRDGLLVALKLS